MTIGIEQRGAGDAGLRLLFAPEPLPGAPGSVPALSMTLPPPAEIAYSEIQKMMALAPQYGFEFVLPKQ